MCTACSFCHQCEQWLCANCKKIHAQSKVTKNHTYTVLAEKSQQLKKEIAERIKLLHQKIEEIQISAKGGELAIKEFKAAQKDAFEKSKVLRQAFHNDIDKYLDNIDERIASFYSTHLKTFQDHNQNTIAKLKACVNLTSDMDNLRTQNEGKLLADGEKMLSQAKELLQSLSDQTYIDAVEIPQVRLERRQDWSLEGAVDLQLQQVQRSVRMIRIK